MSAHTTDHEEHLPEGPDEVLGFTEAGKSWIGILLAVGTLAVLVWTAISFGST